MLIINNKIIHLINKLKSIFIFQIKALGLIITIYYYLI